ncbi:MAG TPA: class III extradiol dioxygenase subunit B-like domain-containing protein, partial [Pyrinomonadaceae bacterium]
MAEGSIVYVGIAPHPPIMVPEVGRESVVHVRASVEAMRDMTERIVASGAETVVLISPHAPLDTRAFVAYHEPRLRGDFANFRAPHATIDAPLDADLLRSIVETAAAERFAVKLLEGYEMDHGTAVPLYFLLRNGWQGSVVALGYTFLSNEEHIRFGRSIRNAVEKSGRRVAFVASGDLSHRLKPGAPAGYNPEAHLFDEQVVAFVRDGQPQRIADIDPSLRHTAG